MFWRYVFVLLFFFLNSLQARLDDKKLNEIKDYIEKCIKEWNIPGLGLVIIQDGKVFFEGGFGVREVNRSDHVDEHTVFSIASCTKPFLAHLVAKLVDEGKIRWNDPVRKYRPNFFIGNEETSEAFTIRDLMSHNSGLPHFSADSLWDLDFSAEDVQKGLSQIELKKPFKKSYGYQNHLFGTMSLIVEKITGKSIQVLFQETFFRPLEMNDSSVGYEAIAPKFMTKIKSFFGYYANIAKPHHTLFSEDGTNKYIESIPYYPEAYLYPGSTGINTSTHDLGKWLLFLMNSHQKILSSKEKKRLLEPRTQMRLKEKDAQFPAERITDIFYCTGMFRQNYGTANQKTEMFSHMGALGGWRSYYGFLPKEKFGFAIVTNLGTIRINLFTEALRSFIMDKYMGLPTKDWSHMLYTQQVQDRKSFIHSQENERRQMPRAHSSFSVLIGKYENDFYGSLDVEEKDQQLTLRYRDKVIPLKHFNGDRFNFNPHLLSPCWNGFDIGFIEFGEINGKLSCYISQMNEGKNPLFKKVN